MSKLMGVRREIRQHLWQRQQQKQQQQDWLVAALAGGKWRQWR